MHREAWYKELPRWQASNNSSIEKAEATIAYLGLGGNIGDSEGAIAAALGGLNAVDGISIRRVSSLYRTAPIGVIDQPDFLNAVAEIETSLSPENLIAAVLDVESRLGRRRTQRWGPRVIDIDVLLFGDRSISTPRITVPHPRMHERAFALVPLAELAPTLRIPGQEATGTVYELATELSQATRIVRIEPGLNRLTETSFDRGT